MLCAPYHVFFLRVVFYALLLQCLIASLNKMSTKMGDNICRFPRNYVKVQIFSLQFCVSCLRVFLVCSVFVLLSCLAYQENG